MEMEFRPKLANKSKRAKYTLLMKKKYQPKRKNREAK